MTPESLTFLYNDSDLFVVVKPPRVHSVSIEGGGASVATELLALDPSLSGAAPTPGDAGLLQRLDYDTSGVLLGAKNRRAWVLYHDAILRGLITKEYIALLEGCVEKEHVVSSFIGSPYRRSKKVRLYSNDPGSRARALWGETSLTPLLPYKEFGSLVKVTASPARRHQVRAHCASIGHPLVGDSLYGSTLCLEPSLAQKRDFFLHAERVSFPLLTRSSKEEITAISQYQAFLESQ